MVRPSDAPRLDPRPVYRPAVDQASARVFGRPSDTAGSFGSVRAEEPRIRNAPPPDPMLAEAYGRPGDADDTLQRPPSESGTDPDGAEGEPDPWRDPDSAVRLGPPVERTAHQDLPLAPKLTLREVLFDRRVEPRALAALAGLAVVIAMVGGLVVALITSDNGSLTSRGVSLTQVAGGDQLPSGAVARVADAVLPSVVSIQVTLGTDAGTGSGVVIDGDGYIVTNNHVVSMAATNPDAKVQVTFDDGTKVPASIVGRDIKTDLAVLAVEDVDNLVVAELGRSEDVQVGEDVVAVGSPLGLSKTVTRGIVSALHRPMRLSGQGTDTDAVIDAVQTDASINPGNSGGPLVDAEGRVIGINSAIKSETGGSVGLGFAIPIDDVTEVVQELIRNGEMKHPEIGVNARTVVNDVASGAEIANVQQDGPAQRAGIVEGDVIVKVGDREVASSDELVVAVHAQKIGEPVTVQLVRSGRIVDVQVTPESD
ncbi:trypsin-like peptidase domain-containing protein [Rhodococcus sp. CC-R104]|uniref:Trypsin-like peptidase domain-containing protein n=1 Tax=Rhodococcus chondri TaxID=3065941 RepID=A0ABU7JUI8_9NOCA|nr:trypsin-like peptidase domain-containing protein [Rhodococcus sp. CC-R104]MEE2033692.1 trypsin-like peptidase domain-containing protein [Rhodococcus sp. CC-R104]